MFLRTQCSAGDHVDTFTDFNESVEFMFCFYGSKHPMHDLIHKLCYAQTPKAQMKIKNECGTKIDGAKIMMQPCLTDITADIQIFSESKRK